MHSERTHSEAPLNRAMGLFPAAAMVAGIILGASIFVQPSEISQHVSTIPAMFAVWVAAGAMTLCGALVCAELASAFPRTGGVYVFLKEGISPAAGFLWGWAMFWSVHSGIIAAIAVVFARYAGHFTPLDDAGIRIVAIGGILLLSGVNYLGVRLGSTVQTILTFAKVLAIALILIFVFVLAAPSHTVQQASTSADWPAPHAFLLALIAGLFSFGGWHMVTYAAGETRDAKKTIPRALLIGTLVVTACYLGLNAAYLRVLPLPKLIASQRVAADAASALVGDWGAAAVSMLVIVSALGSLNGIILAGPRVYFAMAQDGLAFRWLSAVHPQYQTPHTAILLQALLSSALVATGTYRALFTRVIYTEWLFFGLMTLGLFRLRRRAGYAPASRVWGFPVAPLLFIVACAAIVINQIAEDPWESTLGLLLVAVGLPVYYLWARKNAAQGASTNGHH
ncbi:MAG: amino acid permease [Acidobacteria bacterium]|nr:amino acid permease [Acidobacteriota bacterium]